VGPVNPKSSTLFGERYDSFRRAVRLVEKTVVHKEFVYIREAVVARFGQARQKDGVGGVREVDDVGAIARTVVEGEVTDAVRHFDVLIGPTTGATVVGGDEACRSWARMVSFRSSTWTSYFRPRSKPAPLSHSPQSRRSGTRVLLALR